MDVTLTPDFLFLLCFAFYFSFTWSLKTTFSPLHRLSFTLTQTQRRPLCVPALLPCVVWAALYAGCQLAVELISGLPPWLADPIRLWKLGWLDWHTPSNPASNRLWPYTGVWLLRTSQSRSVQAFFKQSQHRSEVSLSSLLPVVIQKFQMRF